jgi:hypothetical protein
VFTTEWLRGGFVEFCLTVTRQQSAGVPVPGYATVVAGRCVSLPHCTLQVNA